MRIRIGHPYVISDSEAVCPASLAGLHTDLPDVHGADTFQALCLALALVRRLLASFTASGGRLLFSPDDGSGIDTASVWDLHGPPV